MARLSKNLTVLYVINIFQPIGLDAVHEESKKVIGEVDRTVVENTLEALRKGKLVVKAEDGQYSCSTKGVQRMAKLGLSRVRDKNRMLVIAELMKRR